MTRPSNLRLSINRSVVNKHEGGDKRQLAEGFENREVTIEELRDEVVAGYAYSAQVAGRRNQKNFVACDVLSVDIDAPASVEAVLNNPFVAKHAALVYTTVSHRPERPRLRVVFITPHTITDPIEMRAALRSLALRLGGDIAATDPARIFFGSRDAQTWMLDGSLSEKELDELIAQSFVEPVSDLARRNGRIATSRSRLTLDPNQPIRRANGETRAVSDLPDGPVYCPHHQDNRPSAYVVRSQNGLKGIYCSKCAQTYWTGREVGFDSNSFVDAVRRAQEFYKNNSDSGPLGPFFDPTARRTTLVGSRISLVTGRPAPEKLGPGLTLIKSPKGSGKTTSLKWLIKPFRRVLLIGHRRSLLRASCEALDLVCYLDDHDEGCNHDRYGVCINSLARVANTGVWDLVVVDESDQVLPAFLSDLLANDGDGNRDRLFQIFQGIIGRAKAVVALDADLGWTSFSTLTEMLPPRRERMRRRRRKGRGTEKVLVNYPAPPVHIWINETMPGTGRSVSVFTRKADLVSDLLSSLAAGRRCFVTSNNKAELDALKEGIQSKMPGLRVLTINSETTTSAEAAAFISAPAVEALKYDLVMTTPALGTGVDITFPNGAQGFDTAYGLCFPMVNTHLDFDQQIGRVRNPKQVKVWITPQRFGFETNAGVVRLDLQEKALFQNVLIDTAEPGAPRQYRRHPFIDMAALVIAKERASKNNLLASFVDHKRAEGYEVVFVDAAEAEDGAALLALGRNIRDDKRRTLLLEAEDVTDEQFETLATRVTRNERLTTQERAAFDRAELRTFYRRAVTADLIDLDDCGRYRRAVIRHERLRVASKVGRRTANLLEPLDAKMRVVRRRGSEGEVLGRLFALTPIFVKGEFSQATQVESAQLADFARFSRENKGAIETALDLEIRADVAFKPVQQLNVILKSVGLRLVPVGTRRHQGEKTYKYQLEPQGLRTMNDIIAARGNVALAPPLQPRGDEDEPHESAPAFDSTGMEFVPSEPPEG